MGVAVLSHTLLILKNYATFKDVQMMLKQYFDISTGLRFSKLQWGSVPSIPVAVLGLVYTTYKMSCSSHILFFWFLVDSYQKTIISAVKFVGFSKKSEHCKMCISLEK